MSSIPVSPAVGTTQLGIAVAVMPNGSAAAMHAPISPAGVPAQPMTDASAQAFTAAMRTFASLLMPGPPPAQRGPFFFNGFFG